jgi:hypothetical protein
MMILLTGFSGFSTSFFALALSGVTFLGVNFLILQVTEFWDHTPFSGMHFPDFPP